MAFVVPHVSIRPAYDFCLANISDYRTAVGFIPNIKISRDFISNADFWLLVKNGKCGNAGPMFSHSHRWLELSGQCPQKPGSNSLFPHIPCPSTSLKAPTGICVVTAALECNISEGKDCEPVPWVELCPQHTSAQCWAVHRHLISIYLIMTVNKYSSVKAKQICVSSLAVWSWVREGTS